MRIAVFGYAQGRGGAQTAFRELLRFLSNEGHHVGAIALAERAEEIGLKECQPNSILVIRPDSSNLRHRGIKFGQLIKAKLRTICLNPEMFISVGVHQSASLIGRGLRGSAFRICQDFVYGRDLQAPEMRGVPKSFDALAVQAPSMVCDLQDRRFAAMPVNWLPCFPEKPVEGIPRSELSSQSIRLAYFGRLAGNKGLDLFLKTFAHAALTSALRLDLWGDGPEKARLAELISQFGLQDKVALKGSFGNREEYARLLTSYHAIVLPSTACEGLPLTLLEAMAYGVPFLATKVGAIPDCAVNNPDVVLGEPNLESLSEALALLLEKITAGQINSNRLQQYYRSHFSHDVLEARWRMMLADPSAFFASSWS